MGGAGEKESTSLLVHADADGVTAEQYGSKQAVAISMHRSKHTVDHLQLCANSTVVCHLALLGW